MQKEKTGRSRRAGPRQQSSSVVAVERLLYSREQTAHALGGVSVATIQRLENAGKLDKSGWAGDQNVFHRVEQVQRAGAPRHCSDARCSVSAASPPSALRPRASAARRR